MTSTFIAYFGKPRPKIQDTHTLPLVTRMLLMLIVSVIAFCIAIRPEVLFPTDDPAATVQTLALYAQFSRIMGIFCWGAFALSLIIAIVIAVMLATSRKPLICAMPHDRNPVHEISFTVNAEGIRFTFEEPFALAKTPWSHTIATAKYLCQASGDTLQDISIKDPWYLKGHHLLILRGRFHLERTVNDITEPLGSLTFRRTLGCSRRRLYLWIPDLKAASLAKAIQKYTPRFFL